jgi:hypothetical protein
MEAVKYEKRKKVILSPEESRILKWLYFKTLIPAGIVIAISSTVLFLGLQSLMTRASFSNYGLAPTTSAANAMKFVATYAVVALSNIVLIIALSAVILYLVLHDMVLPVMRITRELKNSMETRQKTVITIRSSDRLLKPLVELINRMIAQFI